MEWFFASIMLAIGVGGFIVGAVACFFMSPKPVEPTITYPRYTCLIQAQGWDEVNQRLNWNWRVLLLETKDGSAHEIAAGTEASCPNACSRAESVVNLHRNAGGGQMYVYDPTQPVVENRRKPL